MAYVKNAKLTLNNIFKFRLGLILVVSGGLIIGGLIFSGRPETGVPRAGKLVQVVAAENFWGSLVSQLGGDRVQVVSIVSDPNADPHEYASNTNNARAFATADYVILNGAGYDSWGDKLLSADINPGRRVLRIADLLHKAAGDNPHFWYSPADVNLAVAQMEKDLIEIDPANATYYHERYQSLQSALAPYQNRLNSWKRQYGGTTVAATEDIFEYLAQAADLNLISPPAFIQAVAEGNDPPAGSIVKFEDQLKGGQVHLLVYNEQTITPLTDSIKKMAAAQGLPVVGITETIQPPNISFQDWMDGELIVLQQALNTPARSR